MRRGPLLMALSLAIVSPPVLAADSPPSIVIGDEACLLLSDTIGLEGVSVGGSALLLSVEGCLEPVIVERPSIIGSFEVRPPSPPDPPLRFVRVDALWSGPNELVVSWETNVAAKVRVAWGRGPGAFEGYVDSPLQQAVGGVRIPNVNGGAPVHAEVVAVSESFEIVTQSVDAAAYAAPLGPPPNVGAAAVSSVVAVGAAVAVRRWWRGRA